MSQTLSNTPVTASCRVWQTWRVLPAALAIVTAPTAGLAEATELLMERTLPLALARAAASVALSACEVEGYHVSVAVLDRDGLIKVLLRSDGAGPHTLDSSSRKAYTSASLRHSTRALAALLSKDPTAAGLRDMNENILILGGGLPIKVGDDVIGGIGVGGAPGAEKDEACAAAGIDGIRQHLK